MTYKKLIWFGQKLTNPSSSYDGVPAAANGHAMNDILRGEWNWDGFVSSDSGAIDFLCLIHHICETSTAGSPNPVPAKIALDAGNDMEVSFPAKFNSTCQSNFLTPRIDR